MEPLETDREVDRQPDRFTIRGVLHDQPVFAVWTPDLLVGDPAMLVVAEAVIAAAAGLDGDGQEVVPSWRSLSGAALALIHAVDRVVVAEVSSGSLRTRISSDDT